MINADLFYKKFATNSEYIKLTTLFFDDFSTYADNENLNVFPWQNIGNNAMNVDATNEVAKARSNSPSGAPLFDASGVDVGESDVIIQTNLTRKGSTATAHVTGIVFRWQDKNNCFIFGHKSTSQEVILTRVIAGVLTTIQASPVSVPVGVSALMKVVTKGDNIKCYANDNLVYEVTNTNFQNETIHGMTTRSTAAQYWYDYLEIAKVE